MGYNISELKLSAPRKGQKMTKTKQKKHQKEDKMEAEAPVIVFASIVKDAQGQFTLSLMPVSYLEKRYGFFRQQSESCKLPN